MTKDQARAALAFLDRITLAPREIPALHDVAAALNAIANPQPKVEVDSDDSTPVS